MFSDKKEGTGYHPSPVSNVQSLLKTYTELLQEISTPEKGLTFVLGCMYITNILWTLTEQNPQKVMEFESSCKAVTPPI